MSVAMMNAYESYGDTSMAEFFGTTADIYGYDPSSILLAAFAPPESAPAPADCQRQCATSPDPVTCIFDCVIRSRFPGSRGEELVEKSKEPWNLNIPTKWIIIAIGAALVLIGVSAAIK